MKNIFKVFIISLLPLHGFAQEDGAMICSESKQAAFARMNHAPKARIAYPGDDKIDITYYKLNLNLSHSQQYLRGEATVTLKAKSAISSFFLDLRNILKVDSIKLASKKLTYVQDASKVTIMLDKQYTENQAINCYKKLTFKIWVVAEWSLKRSSVRIPTNHRMSWLSQSTF